MSHLLLAQKHHQLLLKNVESCYARDVHTIVVTHVKFGGHVGPIVLAEAIGLGRPVQFAAARNHVVAEVYVADVELNYLHLFLGLTVS